MSFHRWGQKEIAMLCDMWLRGRSIGQIAKRMKLSHSVVNSKIGNLCGKGALPKRAEMKSST